VTLLKPLTTAFALAGLATAGLGLATSSAAAETKAVLELFTSQGCSSCPPADKLLGEYAQDKDVLALSFNVDYWDYLGWKDTLASPDYSQRQRNYAASRGDRRVYTPQIVIDGRTHVVGSSRQQVESAIAANASALTVPITLTPDDDAVTVNIGASADANPPHGTLWLVMYDRSVTVPIDRGENTGKTITYTNVVRKMRPITMWKGEAMSVDLPKSEIDHAGVDNCAVILQIEADGGLPGPILGAATLEMATGT
jgi:hypothetical protein